MKKILFMLGVAVCALAACDPVHEDISNGGHITADELKAMSTVIVDKVVKIGDQKTYTATKGTPIVLMENVDVQDCNGVILYFDKAIDKNWEVSFLPDGSFEKLPGGITSYRCDFGKKELGSLKQLVLKHTEDTEENTITVKGIAIGESTITVTAQDGSYDTMHVKVTQFVPAPTLNYKSLTLSAGDKVYNAVENAVSSVTWSTSNSKVAKVNKQGRITAVGYGKCTIRAKTVSNNKTYDLACTVKVNRSTPNFRAWIVRYDADKKLMKIKIQNLSKVPMVFYGKNGLVLDRYTEKTIRKCQLKKGTSITIPKKKAKVVYLKVKGKKLDPDAVSDYYLRLSFKQDKRDYYAWIVDDSDNGMYSWKKKPEVYYGSYNIDD